MKATTSPPDETTLLVDGDVVAFIAAAAVQNSLEDTYGYVWPFANIGEGQATVENMMYRLVDGLKATHVRVILSDPVSNWRWEVEPTYKKNRETGTPRPLLLGRLKDYMRVRFGAEHWAGLEADDVLGILMTEPQAYPGKRILFGRDKDFKSIPGLHHQWGDMDPQGRLNVRSISQWEADRFHLIQTLAGDHVDGYKGCPGLGMVRAERLIDNPVRLVPKEGAITRGERKGTIITKWHGEPTQDYWACIVSHYKSEGLGEKDALRTARLARILRHGEYDRATERITLWTPEMLQGTSHV
jgi:hypothetical protein